MTGEIETNSYGATMARHLRELRDAGVRRAVAAVRHSAREFEPGRHDLENPLTEEGRACARAFGKALPPLFKRIHGGIRHRGRLPGGREAVFLDPAEVRRQLAEAIRNEDFEEAARLRDRLRRLGHAEGEDADSDPEQQS